MQNTGQKHGERRCGVMARYIDADALKKMFVDGVRVHKGMCSVMNVIHNINNAPTADVEEVKHGYWINHYSDLYPADCTQECSICHAEEGGNLWNDNYCPNCGARMDGRSET